MKLSASVALTFTITNLQVTAFEKKTTTLNNAA